MLSRILYTSIIDLCFISQNKHFAFQNKTWSAIKPAVMDVDATHASSGEE